VSALGVEEQRVNVVLDFTDAPERVETLGDGYRVEAQIVVYRQMNSVMAPVAALFRDGEGWAVFVLEGERARKRAVKTSRRNVAEALVDEGLQPGERVVVYPSDALRDGSRVEVLRKGQR
jgi:HlyD family secretion protein